MYSERYVFSQLTIYLSQKYFNRLVYKYNDRTQKWGFSHWNHLLVLIFGQLIGCDSLRGLVDILTAHSKRAYHLGFGKNIINKTILSRANEVRNLNIFQDFALYMINIAQKKRIINDFCLHGKFYAIDATIIDLCKSIFKWAHFRESKSGVKIHTQIDITTEVPTFYRITNANIHDVRAMDWIKYEHLACYIFDRGYFDLNRLFNINLIGAFFVIREKGRPKYEILSDEQLIESDNVLLDQTIRFIESRNKSNYPSEMRRIVYYAPDLKRTFTYYTNNFYLKATEIALLYKYRWQIELFFKFIKQHLKVKSFWGKSETAVSIQIHIAIITYCLVAIVEKDLKLDRPIAEVIRILGSSLLVKDPIRELFTPLSNESYSDGFQLKLNL